MKCVRIFWDTLYFNSFQAFECGLLRVQSVPVYGKKLQNSLFIVQLVDENIHILYHARTFGRGAVRRGTVRLKKKVSVRLA